MAILNIRNLPEDVHARLRVRAARAGRSMEAEARAILAAAVQAEAVPLRTAVLVQDWVTRLYERRKPRDVVERLLAERRRDAGRE